MGSGGRESPKFPVTIKCATFSQATELSRAHAVLHEISKLDGARAMAEAISKSAQLGEILSNYDQWYCVVWAMRAGIFMDQ